MRWPPQSQNLGGRRPFHPHPCRRELGLGVVGRHRGAVGAQTMLKIPGAGWRRGFAVVACVAVEVPVVLCVGGCGWAGLRLGGLWLGGGCASCLMGTGWVSEAWRVCHIHHLHLLQKKGVRVFGCAS